MAEGKNTVFVYRDWIDKFEELEDDEAGRLIKHFFRYVNDLNPEYPDKLTKIAFIDIKNSLRRDLEKWDQTLEGRSKAGKASAEARRLLKESKQVSTNLTNVDFVKKNSTNPTDSVSDSVSDSDILLKKETKEIFSFKNSLITFGFNQNLVEDWLKVRKTKKATNTETAFKKFIEQVLKTNASYNEILELCIERSWSGFNSEWYAKEKNSTEKEKPMAGRMTETAIKNTINAFL